MTNGLGTHCLSMRLQIFSGRQAETYILWLCALRVSKYEFSVYTVRILMKCTHVCGPKTLLTLYQIINKLKIKPDFPSLADAIAEPRPDMNIKVAAFAVREKSINKLYVSEVKDIFLLTN